MFSVVLLFLCFSCHSLSHLILRFMSFPDPFHLFWSCLMMCSLTSSFQLSFLYIVYLENQIDSIVHHLSASFLALP